MFMLEKGWGTILFFCPHDDFGTIIEIITPPGVSFFVASTVTPVLRITSTALSIEP